MAGNNCGRKALRKGDRQAGMKEGRKEGRGADKQEEAIQPYKKERYIDICIHKYIHI